MPIVSYSSLITTLSPLAFLFPSLLSCARRTIKTFILFKAGGLADKKRDNAIISYLPSSSGAAAVAIHWKNVTRLFGSLQANKIPSLYLPTPSYSISGGNVKTKRNLNEIFLFSWTFWTQPTSSLRIAARQRASWT